MAKKPPTKADKEWYDKIVQLGCIVCGAPAIVHHLTGAGMGLRSNNLDSIPLCPSHHNMGDFGECVHNGTKTFEENYGTQEELLEKTRRLLNVKF